MKTTKINPTIENLVQELVGRTAEANHPITVLNPNKTFIVTEAKYEHDRVFVRGEDTCWFGLNTVQILKESN